MPPESATNLLLPFPLLPHPCGTPLFIPPHVSKKRIDWANSVCFQTSHSPPSSVVRTTASLALLLAVRSVDETRAETTTESQLKRQTESQPGMFSGLSAFFV